MANWKINTANNLIRSTCECSFLVLQISRITAVKLFKRLPALYTYLTYLSRPRHHNPMQSGKSIYTIGKIVNNYAPRKCVLCMVSY